MSGKEYHTAKASVHLGIAHLSDQHLEDYTKFLGGLISGNLKFPWALRYAFKKNFGFWGGQLFAALVYVVFAVKRLGMDEHDRAETRLTYCAVACLAGFKDKSRDNKVFYVRLLSRVGGSHKHQQNTSFYHQAVYLRKVEELHKYDTWKPTTETYRFCYSVFLDVVGHTRFK